LLFAEAKNYKERENDWTERVDQTRKGFPLFLKRPNPPFEEEHDTPHTTHHTPHKDKQAREDVLKKLKD
jgi:hypothetical protein